MGVFDWFKAGDAGGPSSGTRTDAVARITRVLQALPPERARFVAAFAYHLGRIAHADHRLTEAELASMREIVSRETGFSPDLTAVVVDLVAQESLLFRGTEDYQVMREFDEIATPEQKLGLIRCLFAVSAADHQVVVNEDNEIRRIAIALKISHEDFVAARASVREYLAGLKKQPLSIHKPPDDLV